MHKIQVDSIESSNGEISVSKPLAYTEDHQTLSDLHLVHRQFLSTTLANYATLPPRILSGLQYIREEGTDDVTITAGTWGTPTAINDIPADTDFLNILPSASGKERYVRFYATEEGTVLKVEGAESDAGLTEHPEIPANTLGLYEITVNDAGIDGDPTVDLTGYIKSDPVSPIAISNIWGGTEAQYDAIAVKNPNIIYLTIP